MANHKFTFVDDSGYSNFSMKSRLRMSAERKKRREKDIKNILSNPNFIRIRRAKAKLDALKLERQRLMASGMSQSLRRLQDEITNVELEINRLSSENLKLIQAKSTQAVPIQIIEAIMVYPNIDDGKLQEIAVNEMNIQEPVETTETEKTQEVVEEAPKKSGLPAWVLPVGIGVVLILLIRR